MTDSLKEAINLTVDSLKKQVKVSMSPCQEIDGRWFFCAGALFVAEYISLTQGKVKKHEFLELLKHNKRSELIVSEGARFGLNHLMVKAVILQNDGSSDDERLDNTIQLLNNFKHKPEQLITV